MRLRSLGYQDSNLEWLNQNQLCCQLHHTPLGITRFVLTSLATGDNFSGEYPACQIERPWHPSRLKSGLPTHPSDRSRNALPRRSPDLVPNEGDEAGAERGDQAREARRARRRASEDSRPRISMDSNSGGET